MAASTTEAADRVAITDLMVAYAQAVDAQDWDAYRALFKKEGIVDYSSSGGVKGDVETVARWMERTFKMFSRSQHVLSNFQFKFDDSGPRTSRSQPSSCEVRCYLYNPMSLRYVPFPRPFFVCGGTYIVWVERSSCGVGGDHGGGWLIRHLDQDMMYNTIGTTIVLLAVMLLAVAALLGGLSPLY